MWLIVILAAAFGSCSRPSLPVSAANAPLSSRLDRAHVLACLGAPPDAIYEPERLAAPPEPGLSVHTFDQEVSRCGTVRRRYLSYVPTSLAARSTAPVLIVLHGQGASAEAMMSFQTHGTFNRLADAKGLVVIYGNGLPTSLNFAGLLNSGRWRSEPEVNPSGIDDVGYLDRIAGDLLARGVIAGGNDLYLIGQSNGGGMALRAARERPEAYAGVAAFMPFVGFSPSPPPHLEHTRLRRVMFVYSYADPGLPPSYTDNVLVPLGQAWAGALGLGTSDGLDDVATALPNVVTEGQGQETDAAAVRATRASSGQRLDRRREDRAFRQLVFDRAGHFWPTRQPADPDRVLVKFGLRNQDVEGATEVAAFFLD